MRFNPNVPLNMTWRDDFESILLRLEPIAHSEARPLNRHMVARSLLALLKEGVDPTAQDVFNRVREDLSAHPAGGPVGYDMEKWFGYISRTAVILASGQPVDVLR